MNIVYQRLERLVVNDPQYRFKHMCLRPIHYYNTGFGYPNVIAC